MKKGIICNNIYKSYGDLPVLMGIDLEIESGEIVAIVGPSGAGKTTLLQILGTLDTADTNAKTKIEIEGVKLQNMKPARMAAFRNEHLGFIFQFHELLPEFTALENVCVPGWIANKNAQNLKEKAAGLLNQMGLSDRIHHKPQELSGGEQQRVAVARALINDPKVIFADEPSGNLDSQNAASLHNFIFKFRNQTGCTFVIVTHNDDLAEMADRKILLKDGKIIS
ncbi:ABC transporter ATP-binding protein [Flavobacteriaceae bacterium]|nr:ABC transporter ATP-binding protein [Flavobacteriaceae bacterium]